MSKTPKLSDSIIFGSESLPEALRGSTPHAAPWEYAAHELHLPLADTRGQPDLPQRVLDACGIGAERTISDPTDYRRRERTVREVVHNMSDYAFPTEDIARHLHDNGI